LLLSLRSRDATEISLEPEKDEAKRKIDDSRLQDSFTPSSTSCAFCKVSLPTVVEQREHVRSDFHRYNLKLKLKRCSPVDEPTFDTLVEDLDESLSGSESSGPDLEDSGGDENPQGSVLAALLKRQSKISQQPEDEDDSPFNQRKGGVGNAPLLWLSSSELAAEMSLGVYRALLTKAEQNQDLLEVIKNKQLKPVQAKNSSSVGQTLAQEVSAQTPHYFLCMLGGGHFAAMVVSLAPDIRKGPSGREERHVIVKAHKTFHRYTTRRKQGGSQAANDNSKGNAHSAGSSIRRYNEMALEADVRGVLSDWKDMIEKSELLFIRAAGTTSRRTLYGPYEGQVLRANDTRLRGFPFSTRRATQAELMRSFTELTRLKVRMISQSALNAASAEQEKPDKPKASARERPPEPSAEDEAAAIHTSQIQVLIRRTKAPALLTYLTKNSLSPNFPFFPPNTPQHHHAPTALHLAASNNSPALVLALLTKARADATLVNGDGRTAFDVAGDGKTRDAFRIARHSLGEAALDWQVAHVPLALSQQDAEDRQQKEKAQEDAAEAQRRKTDLDKLRREEEAQSTGKIEKRAGAGHILGSRDKTGAEKREEEGRGLAPEMRTKLERERRARAAEERMRKMQGNR
jgi:Bacteroidetes VLRF1 release factor/Ankyrin repeats (many copies)